MNHNISRYSSHQKKDRLQNKCFVVIVHHARCGVAVVMARDSGYFYLVQHRPSCLFINMDSESNQSYAIQSGGGQVEQIY